MVDKGVPVPKEILPHHGDLILPYKLWIRLFDNYIYMRDAARTRPFSDEDKNCLLFNLLGLEGIGIFSAQPMVDRISTASHDEFRSAVKSVFQVPVNPFRAYYDLEQRRQGSTESTQDYLTALRSLMADCDFDGRENHHLAVRLVCRCFNHETQKKLLALPKIDLDEVVRIMQADESASHSQVAIGGQTVFHRLAHKPSPQQGNTKQPGTLICTNCGRRGHRAKDIICPALNQTCSLCTKLEPHLSPWSADRRVNNGDTRSHSDSVDIAQDYLRLLSNELGTFPDYQHEILLTDDAVPSAKKLRPVPLARRQKVSEEIQNMDDLGIWQATDKSSWVHLMVTVPKPNGDYRITTDLSPLNRYVVPDRFPLPNPNDLFLELRGANVFTKLDIRKAFFHIELAPDSRHLTTTLTHQGLRQYKRLPMGLQDSASVCQRLVSQTLADCPGTIAYIDDILIFGSTRAEHDANLRMALQQLSDKDFRLQLALALQELHFWGMLSLPTGSNLTLKCSTHLGCSHSKNCKANTKTDHSSLASLLRSTTDSRKSAKFTRWLDRLSPFDYTVEYRQGKDNLVADALSRLSMRSAQFALHDPTHDHVVGALQTDHLSLLDVKSATKRDSTLSTVLHFVSSGWPSKKSQAPDIQQFFAVRDELQTEDQCLLRENRIVLPTALRRRLLAKAHEGHPGIVRIKRKLRQSYWWPGQDKDIENFVKHCAGCQLSDKSLAPANVSATSIPLPESPWQKVAIDVTGPFLIAPQSSKFLMVLIDYKSKFPEILMASNYLKHGIQAFHASGEAWASGIQALLRNYRATAATPQGRSPDEVMFHRPLRLPFQIPASAHRARPPSPQLATSASDAQGVHLRGPYRVGDRVLARRPQVLKGQSPWSKPLTVLKVLGNWTYQLSDGQKWNARKLRRYLEPEAPLLHHHETTAPPVRRSQRQNRGVPPARYPNELWFTFLHKLSSYYFYHLLVLFSSYKLYIYSYQTAFLGRGRMLCRPTSMVSN
ncbi:Zf-h2c2 and rve domain containing protein [Plakobranchus ocellatus]|uniref:Zf-h2c2 and rve domain containing protein n=1 Tax=Plakobranchus ocellatus TaxID=259542 RepID=A0AAV4DT94_9GAST|nr:Zf-h2c2 and rve domain containing protein [Plakobranchus ocellatus]